MSFRNAIIPVIPALDLLKGRVVKAIAGERKDYKPLRDFHKEVFNEGVSSPSRTPSRSISAKDIAEKLLDISGSQALYLADLDAIAGGSVNWEIIQSLLQLPCDLWLDAGIRTAEDARRLFFQEEIAQPASQQPGPLIGPLIARLIVGTETLKNPSDLGPIVQRWGNDRVMLSLDLRDGSPTVVSPRWKRATPNQIVQDAVTAGVNSVLVLEIASVGMSMGPRTCDLLHALRGLFPNLELIAGGGIRNDDDLKQLASAGVNACVASTWLHTFASLE